MSASLGSLVAELRPFARALVNLAGSAGLQPRITSTRRSHAEQARLYRRFLSGVQPYPVAPPGTSAHEFGMAFDMVTGAMRLSDLKDLGSVWTSWGGVWGGEFDDPIHFELPGFPHKSAQSLRAKIANAAVGFLPGPAGLLASVSPSPVLVDAGEAPPTVDSPAAVGEWFAYQLRRIF